MKALNAIVLLIDFILKPLINFCKLATIGCVLSIALIISISVFFRYALNDSITWSEEIAKYFPYLVPLFC